MPKPPIYPLGICLLKTGWLDFTPEAQAAFDRGAYRALRFRISQREGEVVGAEILTPSASTAWAARHGIWTAAPLDRSSPTGGGLFPFPRTHPWAQSPAKVHIACAQWPYHMRGNFDDLYLTVTPQGSWISLADVDTLLGSTLARMKTEAHGGTPNPNWPNFHGGLLGTLIIPAGIDPSSHARLLARQHIRAAGEAWNTTPMHDGLDWLADARVGPPHGFEALDQAYAHIATLKTYL